MPRSRVVRSEQMDFIASAYRRPSRRGGKGGKRELLVTSRRAERGSRRRIGVVPYIRMSGQWLERLGFRRGDRVEITTEHERIVLTVRREDGELPVN